MTQELSTRNPSLAFLPHEGHEGEGQRQRHQVNGGLDLDATQHPELSPEPDPSDLVPDAEVLPVDAADPRRETTDDPRIPDGKQFFKIGEVARMTGLKPYVLRYWETEFPWIRPSKTSARQRLYRRQDIAVLLQIKRLRYEERRTIADTKMLIRAHRSGDRKSTKTPKRSAVPRVGRVSAVGTALAAAELASTLADMRRAVLDLLEAAED